MLLPFKLLQPHTQLSSLFSDSLEILAMSIESTSPPAFWQNWNIKEGERGGKRGKEGRVWTGEFPAPGQPCGMMRRPWWRKRGRKERLNYGCRRPRQGLWLDPTQARLFHSWGKLRQSCLVEVLPSKKRTVHVWIHYTSVGREKRDKVIPQFPSNPFSRGAVGANPVEISL